MISFIMIIVLSVVIHMDIKFDLYISKFVVQLYNPHVFLGETVKLLTKS